MGKTLVGQRIITKIITRSPAESSCLLFGVGFSKNLATLRLLCNTVCLPVVTNNHHDNILQPASVYVMAVFLWCHHDELPT